MEKAKIALEQASAETYDSERQKAVEAMIAHSAGWSHAFKCLHERIVRYDELATRAEINPASRNDYAQRRLALLHFSRELYDLAQLEHPYDAAAGALYGALERQMRLPPPPKKPAAQAPSLSEQAAQRAGGYPRSRQGVGIVA